MVNKVSVTKSCSFKVIQFKVSVTKSCSFKVIQFKSWTVKKKSIQVHVTKYMEDTWKTCPLTTVSYEVTESVIWFQIKSFSYKISHRKYLVFVSIEVTQ